ERRDHQCPLYCKQAADPCGRPHRDDPAPIIAPAHPIRHFSRLPRHARLYNEKGPAAPGRAPCTTLFLRALRALRALRVTLQAAIALGPDRNAARISGGRFPKLTVALVAVCERTSSRAPQTR